MKTTTLLTAITITLTAVACGGAGAEGYDPTTDEMAQGNEQLDPEAGSSADERESSGATEQDHSATEPTTDPMLGPTEEESGAESTEEPATEEPSAMDEPGAEEAAAMEDPGEEEPAMEDPAEDPTDPDIPQLDPGIILEADYVHPLTEPDGMTYCGAAYEISCRTLAEECEASGGQYECYDYSGKVRGCDIWGACKQAPKIQFDYPEQEEPAFPSDVKSPDPEPQANCSSCSAICQTVSWLSGGSSYDDIDLGGGMSPSACVDQAEAACEAGASRFLFSASCGF